MRVIDCLQGTPEWKAARAGRVTASRICDVLAKIKSGEAAARRDYRAELVVERLTGEPIEDGYTNAAMKWGTETEPLARAAYEVYRESEVEQVGFVIHDSLDMAGASPDGLVGADGLCEIKCPKSATHLGYILDGAVPTQYVNQMQWQMACTGRLWCDFISYDPRFPANNQLFIARCHRDDAWILQLETEVSKFLVEVDQILARLAKLEVEELCKTTV